MRLLVAAALVRAEASKLALAYMYVYVHTPSMHEVFICAYTYVYTCVYMYSRVLGRSFVREGASVRFFALIKGNLSGTRLAIIISTRCLLPLRILPSRALGCFL